MLLGEKLIAFRDTDGRVGIMDHRCPHRCASLFFGRNEEGGIRCVYHGWKFDVERQLPRHAERAAGAGLQAPRQGQGLQGRRARRPDLGLHGRRASSRRRCPTLEVLHAARGRAHHRASTSASATGCRRSRATSTPRISASCMSAALEDGRRRRTTRIHQLGRWSTARRDYKSTETDWGTMYAAYRPADPGNLYYRFAHFMFPFITLTPNGSFEDQVACTLNVPMDDTHTMVYNFTWVKKTAPLQTLKNGDWIPGLKPDAEYLPNTNDWYGRHRLVARRENDYFIDREMQKHVELHRHPGHRPPGPGRRRMHGRDRRSQPRASGAVGPHDRDHAQAAARSLPEADDRRAPCRRWSTTRMLCRARAAARSSRRRSRTGSTPMPRSCRARSARSACCNACRWRPNSSRR